VSASWWYARIPVTIDPPVVKVVVAVEAFIMNWGRSKYSSDDDDDVVVHEQNISMPSSVRCFSSSPCGLLVSMQSSPKTTRPSAIALATVMSSTFADIADGNNRRSDSIIDKDDGRSCFIPTPTVECVRFIVEFIFMTISLDRF